MNGKAKAAKACGGNTFEAGLRGGPMFEAVRGTPGSFAAALRDDPADNMASPPPASLAAHAGALAADLGLCEDVLGAVSLKLGVMIPPAAGGTRPDEGDTVADSLSLASDRVRAVMERLKALASFVGA